MKLRILLLIILTIPCSYARTLTIAVATDNPPFSDRADQDHHFYGFDIDIMTEICKRLSAHCTYKAYILDKLFSEVNSPQIDLAIASITITPERKKEYLFTSSYLTSQVQLLTNKTSSITTLEDMKNKNVGVRLGAHYKRFLLNLLQDQVAVTEYPTSADLREGLAKHHADAIMINKYTAQFWYANNSDSYKLIGTPIPFGAGYGIMTKLGNSGLITEVNQALQQMQTDGTYTKLYNRYFNQLHMS